MTTDKVIAAAREAGATRAYPEAQSNRDDAYLVGQQFLERFYAIAYRAGMERAAEICEGESKRALENWHSDLPLNQPFWNGGERLATSCAESIRNLKDQP